MYIIKEKQLYKIFGKKTDKEFIGMLVFMLNHYAHIFAITTRKEKGFFLGQVKRELGFYKNGKPKMHESLNYKRKQLAKFSKRFRNDIYLLDKAMRLKGIKKQKFIATNWYGYGKKARELGNIKPLDGWMYRGYGLFQITGRTNHYKVWRIVERKLNIKVFNDNGEVLESLLNSYYGAIITAFAYWYMRKIYRCSNANCVTYKINPHAPKTEYKARARTTEWILNEILT